MQLKFVIFFNNYIEAEHLLFTSTHTIHPHYIIYIIITIHHTYMIFYNIIYRFISLHVYMMPSQADLMVLMRF